MLVNTRFQVLFHSPSGVLFTFPSQYCSTIGHRLVFRLGGWAPRLLCGFLVSADTSDTDRTVRISTTRLSRPLVCVPNNFVYPSRSLQQSITPRVFLRAVSPAPLSLAATRGISVDFFSSPYLDVSVRAVPRVYLWIHYTLIRHSPDRVSSFGHPRIKAYLLLPAAFRS